MWSHSAASVVLLLVVVAAWAGGARHGFVWLDEREIVQAGYRITSADDLRLVWTTTLDAYLERADGTTPNYDAGYWRPVYAMSISLPWLIAEDSAVVYHVYAIAWHLAVVMLLYALGVLVVGDRPQGRGAVLLATAAFAAHPLCTQSVMWISGQKDTLCAALGVASLCCLLRAPDGGWRAWLLGALAVVLLLGSLGAKELGLVVVAAGALAVWQRGPGEPRWQVRVGIVIAMIVGAGAYLVYRLNVVGSMGLDVGRPTASALSAVVMSCTLAAGYLRDVLLPHPTVLSDAVAVPTGLSADGLAAVLLVSMLVWVALYGVVRRRAWAFGLAWFAIWLAPVSGIVALRHWRAERYLYPAAWGLLLTVALLLTPVYSWLERRLGRMALALPVLAIALLIVVTNHGNSYWADDATLFADAIERDPRYVEGRVHVATQAYEAGAHDTAIAHFERALVDAHDPTLAAYWSPFMTHHNFGAALYLAGDVHAAAGRDAQARALYRRALEQYQLAVRARPHSAVAHYHLGQTYVRVDDLPAALGAFEQSMRLKPDAKTRDNIAWVKYQIRRRGG